MKKNIFQINTHLLRELFDTDSIDDSFLAFDDLKDAVLKDGKINEMLYNFPFRASEAIIAVCTEGSVRAKLGMRCFTLEKNGLLVALPAQIFEIQEITPDFKAIIFIMKSSFFDTHNNLSEIKEIQQFILKEQGLKISNEYMQEVLTLFRLMKEKIAERNIFSKQIVQHYFYILFYDFYSLVKQQNTPENQKKTATKEYVFERFIVEVEKHYKSQHEIGFYAEKLCITPKYLSRLVCEISGKSAAQWIREYLLLEARTLLKSGKMSIQQISDELYFGDQSHFGVFFKRYVGCSPRAYQQM